MSFVTWKVEQQAFNPSTLTWAAATALTSFNSPTCTVSLGSSKDSFSVKLTDYNNTKAPSFSVNDKITFSRALNSTTVATSDVMMVGSVQNSPHDADYSKDQFNLTGYNFSDIVASAVVQAIDATTATIPVAIQAALAAMSVGAGSYPVVWNYATSSTVTSAGTPFPVVGKQYYNKPLRDFLNLVSSAEVTGDGPYYWFIDLNNTLVWQRQGSLTYSFNDATDIYQSCTISKDVSNVINYVIMQGGVAPDGRVLQIPVTNPGSIAKYGQKFYILPIPGTFQTWMSADAAKMGVQTISSGNYVAGFAPTWDPTHTYASYALYTAAFYNAAIAELQRIGKAYLSQRATGTIQVDVSFAAGTAPGISSGRGWILGNTVNTTLRSMVGPLHPLGQFPLLVTKIIYDQYTDKYTLTQAVGTL